jgi:hypothetical protein
MLVAPWLVKQYKKEMLAMMQEGYDLQMENIMNMIKEASANDLDIYIEMNPSMADNMVSFASGKTEEEEEKVNPFTLVDTDEE